MPCHVRACVRACMCACGLLTYSKSLTWPSIPDLYEFTIIVTIIITVLLPSGRCQQGGLDGGLVSGVCQPRQRGRH